MTKEKILITKKMKGVLDQFKLYPREPYDDVLERSLWIVGERIYKRELDSALVREIDKAKKEISLGKVIATSELLGGMA